MPRKKAANGAGTIRKRPDGRFEARVTIGKDPATGKQKQKSIYGWSQEEVRKKMQKLCVSVDDGTFTEPSKLTVGKWEDIWHAEFLGNVKSGTADNYKQIIRIHIKPAFGAMKLNALQAPLIQKMYNEKQKAGLASKTIRNIHGVLTASLSQAMALGYIPTNPASVCKPPRVEKAEMLPLDMPEASIFLGACKEHRLAILYNAAMLTGMREGELLGLQWRCVDFERGTIRIDKQLLRPRKKGETYRFGSPKNGKERTITPAPSIMEMLKELKLVQKKQRLKAGDMWYDGALSDLVFTDELGCYLKYHTVLDNFKALLKCAGLEERRFHDLRHTYAVLSLLSGIDPKSVSATLGHATVAFTLDRYSHFTETMQKQSAEKMEALFRTL